MACGAKGSILSELHDLVNQIGNGGCDSSPEPCCGPCLTPCNFPFAEVVMVCPPPILPPTRPEPVKPLALRCPPDNTPWATYEEREASRYDNFYNNYNIDWHPESPRYRNKPNFPVCTPVKERGQTVDGKSPCCEEAFCCEDQDKGCPTGFKPTTMKMYPPPCCHPYGVWCAEIQPCHPKPKCKERFDPGDCYKKACKN